MLALVNPGSVWVFTSALVEAHPHRTKQAAETAAPNTTAETNVRSVVLCSEEILKNEIGKIDCNDTMFRILG